MSWVGRIAQLISGGDTGGKQAVAFGAQPAASDARMIDDAFSAGVEAYNSGAYAVALQKFVTVISARHDDAEAHNWLGLVYFKQQALEDANDCFVMATHFRADFAAAWYNLGLVAQQRNDHASAMRSLKQAIEARADYAEAYNALGASALALNDIPLAVDYFEQTVKLRPDYAHAHSNLGYVLFRDCGEYERGAAHIRKALELNSSHANIWCNQTMVLLHEGKLEETISVCDQLLAARPDLDEARLNRALARLKLGDFAQAWPDYEARKKVRSNYVNRKLDFPEWRDEALAGKTVLVHAEQGIGDEIMFVSCLPDLLAQAKQCVLECAPRLERLFRLSFPRAVVHGSDQSDTDTHWLGCIGHIDFQIAAGSLPGHFRRQWAEFPQHTGYLCADPARVAYWSQRMKELGAGLKVGIAWRGGLPSTRRALRSTRLDHWARLLQRPDCHFVSLQYGDGRGEVAALAATHALTVHHWQEAIDAIDETAALISALDLVVSVQTAVVHLAGGLGKPAWVMVPAVPEWRYLQSGDRMPWYPSVRLFRQQQADQWRPVIDRIASNIAQFASGERC